MTKLLLKTTDFFMFVEIEVYSKKATNQRKKALEWLRVNHPVLEEATCATVKLKTSNSQKTREFKFFYSKVANMWLITD
jgi:hypothetical protein